jgi:hypothetical protein
MINDLTNVTQTQFSAQSTPVNPNSTQSKPEPTSTDTVQSKLHPAITDTVQISSGAQAVIQEANETAAQTDQEAKRGDVQAQRLLARRASLKGAPKKSLSILA